MGAPEVDPVVAPKVEPLRRADIRVRGMYCRRCEDVIASELSAVRGVAVAEASWLRASVSVSFDPVIVGEDELSRVLADSGYPPGAGVPGLAASALSIVAIIAVVAALGVIRLPGIPAATSGSSLPYLFAIGLATSAHCVVMCGGLMLAQTSRAQPTGWRRGLGLAVVYNAGRVAACAALGAAFGSLGRTLSYTGTESGVLHALAGAAVVCAGLAMGGLAPTLGRPARAGQLRSAPRRRRPSRCARMLGRARARLGAGALAPLAVGAFNAVMPCGASGAMWLVAASSGQALAGALTMLVWALGTVPLMLVLGALAQAFPKRGVAWALRVNVVLLIALGVRMLLSGLQMIS